MVCKPPVYKLAIARLQLVGGCNGAACMQKGEHQQPCQRLAVEAGHRDMPCAEADQAAQQAATTSMQTQLINT